MEVAMNKNAIELHNISIDEAKKSFPALLKVVKKWEGKKIVTKKGEFTKRFKEDINKIGFLTQKHIHKEGIGQIFFTLTKGVYRLYIDVHIHPRKGDGWGSPLQIWYDLGDIENGYLKNVVPSIKIAKKIEPDKFLDFSERIEKKVYAFAKEIEAEINSLPEGLRVNAREKARKIWNYARVEL